MASPELSLKRSRPRLQRYSAAALSAASARKNITKPVAHLMKLERNVNSQFTLRFRWSHTCGCRVRPRLRHAPQGRSRDDEHGCLSGGSLLIIIRLNYHAEAAQTWEFHTPPSPGNVWKIFSVVWKLAIRVGVGGGVPRCRGERTPSNASFICLDRVRAGEWFQNIPGFFRRRVNA